MTFLEAAVEVLRREGKPLHFKELTRLAIKYDLLSVVGRDPESMMQTRLQAEVRRPSSDLVRQSPGVFGLRSYPPRGGRSEPARAEAAPGASSKTAGNGGSQLELPSSGEGAAKQAGRERGGRRRGRGGGRTAETATTAASSASAGAAAASSGAAAGESAAPASPTPAAGKASGRHAAPASSSPAAAAEQEGGRGKRRRRGGRSSDTAAAPPAAPAVTPPAAVAESPSSPAAPPSALAEAPGPAAAPPPAAETAPAPAEALPASAAEATPPAAAPPAPEREAALPAAPSSAAMAAPPPAEAVAPPSTLTPPPAAEKEPPAAATVAPPSPPAAPPPAETPAPSASSPVPSAQPQVAAPAEAAARPQPAKAPLWAEPAPSVRTPRPLLSPEPVLAPPSAVSPAPPVQRSTLTPPATALAPAAPRPAPGELGRNEPPAAKGPPPGPRSGGPIGPPPPRPSLITTPSPVMAPPPPLSATTPGGSSAAPAAGGGNRPEAPPPPRLMTMADAAYDVLRGSSDGRPLAFRQIAEIALKRRLLRGEPADVARALRTALVREQRQRDSEGLRPRIRTVGPGQYMLSERKLEPELYNAERELLDRLNRTREATRVALRRRLRGLPAGAFELLMRLLLERLGMLGAELIKRGEGVAYYSGQSQRGARSQKVLVAVRPGEAELTREAVGELRAGVRLRSFDEGLLLCAGRASAAALTEAGAVPAIDIYDQDALTDLLIRNQLGVRRMHLPIDYLDAELLGELAEPS